MMSRTAARMRLLDLIAQRRTAMVRSDDGRELTGAGRFADRLRQCPLRYVLTDELTRCATQLAYAEGDRLRSCLDLIHVPARDLWVEWAEGPRSQALEAIPSLEVPGGSGARRGGALVTSSPDCRSGHIRTFWSAGDDRAYLAPMITVFDLDRPPPSLSEGDAGVWRGETVLCMDDEPAIEELLGHLRFYFDDEWAAYYRTRCESLAFRAEVLRGSLSGCAFDAPMLMAFFLLLGSRDLLPRQEVRHERINCARLRAGKPRLLEHIEVSAPLDRVRVRPWGESADWSRLSPRLHHVRGHLVRRGLAVFWRRPHLHGDARLGQVRSRTVMLTFDHSRTPTADPRFPGISGGQPGGYDG
jgi:hypothetical protein